MMHRFYETSDGVHLEGPFGDGRTVCGNVTEGDDDVGLEACQPTDRRVVTCPDCARIVLHCRGVRVAKS